MGEDSHTHSHEAGRRIIDLLTGAWQTQAVSVAARLRIADHIHAGCNTLDQLAARTESGTDGLRRLMRLLVSLGVFSGNEHDGYSLTEIGNLLRSGVGGSMRDMCDIYGQEFYRAWGAALSAITQGSSGFRHAFGQSLGEYLRAHEEASARFQRMLSAGDAFLSEVPAGFSFSSARTVVDIAGGTGALLAAILQHHPGIRGVLFDQDHVLPLARKHVAELGLDGACEFVAGDMFEAVPASGDVYLLSRVLQDWQDEACVALLGTCRAVMSEEAKLLIIERVIPDDGSFDLALLWDLHLLMMVGGRLRTATEYRRLLDAAGLVLEGSVALPLDTHILIAAPGPGH